MESNVTRLSKTALIDLDALGLLHVHRVDERRLDDEVVDNPAFDCLFAPGSGGTGLVVAAASGDRDEHTREDKDQKESIPPSACSVSKRSLLSSRHPTPTC